MRRPPRPLAPERAWDYALWLLGRRAYTAHELDERLRRRGLAPEVRERVAARLGELGLLDDRALAEAFVDRRAGAYGRHRLRGDLLARGVAEDVVDEAVGAAGDDELHAAEACLRQQAWRYAASAASPAEDLARVKRRAFAMLARRGFTPEAARAAVAAVLPAPGDGDVPGEDR